MPKIQSIHVHPVKACKGISVESAAITPAGLKYDRGWMIVLAENGKFVTQRQRAEVALIETQLPKGAMSPDFDETAPSALLTLKAPGMPSPVSVPLAGQPGPVNLRPVSCWAWSGQAADQGDEVAAWLSRYLGTPCRLVKYLGKVGQDGLKTQEGPRGRAWLTYLPAWAALLLSWLLSWLGRAPKAPEQHTERKNDELAKGFPIKFADQYPVLMAAQADMDDLNARMGLTDELSINRFRANIVLSGTQPWEQDGWRDIVFTGPGGREVPSTLVKPCSRCNVPSINQETAEAGEEPSTTLHTFRTGKQLGWAPHVKTWTHMVFFGWNLVFYGPCTLSVGDEVEVKSRKDYVTEGFPVVEAISLAA